MERNKINNKKKSTHAVGTNAQGSRRTATGEKDDGAKSETKGA